MSKGNPSSGIVYRSQLRKQKKPLTRSQRACLEIVRSRHAPILGVEVVRQAVGLGCTERGAWYALAALVEAGALWKRGDLVSVR